MEQKVVEVFTVFSDGSVKLHDKSPIGLLLELLDVARKGVLDIEVAATPAEEVGNG